MPFENDNYRKPGSTPDEYRVVATYLLDAFEQNGAGLTAGLALLTDLLNLEYR